MAAALTIAILFTVSFGLVRIAAVAMRLTGLPQDVARCQSISALTGTGFTTSEAEMIVNYPLRRRILVALMVIGNLGLASVAATFIVSFVGTAPVAGALATQAAMIALAIVVTAVVMTNKRLDHAMCALIGWLLVKTTRLGSYSYHRLLQVDSGFSIAEHHYGAGEAIILDDLPPAFADLVLLAIHGPTAHKNGPIPPHTALSSGDILICYGSDDAHQRFADDLGPAK